MQINNKRKKLIMLNNKAQTDFSSTYLRIVIAVDGGTERDVMVRIAKV